MNNRFVLNETKESKGLDSVQSVSTRYFRKNTLNPMVDAGLLKPTIPDKPKSPDQKYVKP